MQKEDQLPVKTFTFQSVQLDSFMEADLLLEASLMEFLCLT